MRARLRRTMRASPAFGARIEDLTTIFSSAMSPSGRSRSRSASASLLDIGEAVAASATGPCGTLLAPPHLIAWPRSPATIATPSINCHRPAMSKARP